VKSLILPAILLLFPFSSQAGFPEGENGYDLKKIEESFRLPCNEIGNDDCIARALGVGACTWIFGINEDKEPAEALKIADTVLIALIKGNNLDLKSMLEKNGLIKKVIKIPKIPPPTKAISDKYIVNLQAAINWDIMIPSGLPKMFINKPSITKLFYQVKF